MKLEHYHFIHIWKQVSNNHDDGGGSGGCGGGCGGGSDGCRGVAVVVMVSW